MAEWVKSMSALNTPPVPPPPAQSEYLLYVGTYGKGVHAFRFHVASGKLDALGLKGEITNPSFIITDAQHQHLYAVSELEGNHEGGVGAFTIDRKSGDLQKLNTESSAGVAPCHLALDHTGKLLAVANYGTGGVSAFPIRSDGSLEKMSALMKAEGSGPNQKRQTGPHAHEIVFSPDNKYVYVPDLGLDRIRVYDVDTADGTLKAREPVQEQGGLGPRHIVFSHDGKFLYILNEIKTRVTVWKRTGDTAFEHVQSIASLPNDAEADGGAEILLDRAGKFLYTSNRDVTDQGTGSLTVFAVDQATGKVKTVQNIDTAGRMPRGVEFDPTEKYLLAGDQKANVIQIFTVDAATGHLAETGRRYEAPSPVSFAFVPVE